MHFYYVFYNHFTNQSLFLEQKQDAINCHLDTVENIRNEFNIAKEKLKQTNRALNHVKDLSFDDWKENNRQIRIEFDFQEEDLRNLHLI